MLVKLGKKRKLTIDQDFRINYGTINDEEPRSIYIELKTWLNPLEEKESYETDVRKLDKFVRQYLYNNLPSEFYKNYIVDCDLRASGMSTNKRSFMNLEIILYPKDYHTRFSVNKKLQGLIKNISNTLVTDLKKRGGYTFHRTKS